VNPNFILGSPQADSLQGSSCNDAIYGFANNDRLVGRGGEDRMFGRRGSDRLNGIELVGGPRPDVMRGGTGFDMCVGDAEDQYVNCEVVDILT
jgi:Ca2+-binding RTX toxin-like protein